jgi:hypothetical protein
VRKQNPTAAIEQQVQKDYGELSILSFPLNHREFNFWFLVLQSLPNQSFTDTVSSALDA